MKTTEVCVSSVLGHIVESVLVFWARLSMELQRDSHIKQRLIQALEEKLVVKQQSPTCWCSHSSIQPSKAQLQPPQLLWPFSCRVWRNQKRESHDTFSWLPDRQTGACQPLTPTVPGSKTTKSDQNRLEEQQTIEDLRRLVDHLMGENQRLVAETAAAVRKHPARSGG
ncbi:nuclear receptor-binding factor 2b [Lates japonicus]|uniref:Nuclear receptor-binding factor 2b n=1 Tax=Lates japonicus TaxID=270547 RepID=A0AAD3NEP9_LATJO|nr:nuclear receptor-binding factor 2b [Lates japonicus]